MYGYEQTMHVETRPVQIGTWDKAFFYFCHLNRNHSFVWFIEDDVFIPSVQSFLSVHQFYSNQYDLIVKSLIPNWSANTERWPHWSLAMGKLLPPWFRSMTNAMGLSRRLLNSIDDYVQWRGKSTFHEFLPQTLSIHLNMSVVSPVELNTLSWGESFTWDDIQENPNHWWHPVKNWTLQKLWHQRIENDRLINKTNIDWFNLTNLCNSIDDPIVTEEYLQKLVIDFDQTKNEFSLDNRRLLRQHFINLSQHCKNVNDVVSSDIILRQLADSAYKLPENPTMDLIEKSSTYLLIEKKLKENKENVFRYIENSSIVNQLRQQATDLTFNLTIEIQQYFKRKTKNVHRETTREL